MAIDIRMGDPADPFRVYNGADPGSNPLASSLLFSSNYAPNKISRYTTSAAAGAPRTGDIVFAQTFSAAPLVVAGCMPSGTLPQDSDIGNNYPCAQALVFHERWIFISGVWGVLAPRRHFYFISKPDRITWFCFQDYSCTLHFAVYE